MSNELMFAVFGLSGVAAGFFAGLFGIGGGLIMVPVLVYAFKTTGMATEHVVTMALGTSMAAIVFSSAQSAYGHYCKGSAAVDKIRRAAPWVVAGVLIGGAIAARTPSQPLIIFVGAFQLFAALLMLTNVSKLVTFQSLARGGIALSAAICVAILTFFGEPKPIFWRVITSSGARYLMASVVRMPDRPAREGVDRLASQAKPKERATDVFVAQS